MSAVLAIVQARMGSTRLPNKVMKQIEHAPMIEILLERLSFSKKIDKIIVATSNTPENEVLKKHVEALGYDVFMGAEKDVLDRFYQAAKFHQPDIVLRLTGDCPLLDADLVDAMLEVFIGADYDYYSNTAPPTYPDGLDVEIMNFSTLERCWSEAKSDYDKEHVTPYIRSSSLFKCGNFINDLDFSHLRWTVDEAEDLEVIRAIFDHFSPRIDFSWQEVLGLYQEQPTLFEANKILNRNEGAKMSSGQKLWQRAKQIIPGGNMLLSKRAEMFAPGRWPAYFSKAKGCKVWDLDGNEYIDMSIMGVGTNTLGYGHPLVDETVAQVIANGNMSSLNCPEEVYLAERLIDLHPFAEMARFARSGGEANAIAIRIARAASGRDKVAICGYHGWHDWYLSANLGDEKSLDGHLLPGLEPAGVPRDLKGSVLPFNYNDFDALKQLVTSHDVGVIKMEVQRSEKPKNDFLMNVRKLANEHNIVLIFDECTSGFRETFGGLHKKFEVEPDLAVFGKTLGNGYAITAVIGRKEVMEAAQSSFISSTFWTERIGPAAALKTLEVMEDVKSWETITSIGHIIQNRWLELATKHQLKIDLWGLPALCGFSFTSKNALAYKTLITQEALKLGYFGGDSVYVSIAHTPDIIDAYFLALDPIFALIADCEDGRDVMTLLNGPLCHTKFQRLN